MKYLIVVLATILGGCYTLSSGSETGSELVKEEIYSDIPKGSKTIWLYSDTAVDSVYKAIYQTLTSAGFPVINDNIEMGVLTTDFFDADEAGTLLSITVTVIDDGDNTKSVWNGRFDISRRSAAFAAAIAGGSVGAIEFKERAIWNGRKSNRSDIAFAVMTKFAKSIEHNSIEYLTE